MTILERKIKVAKIESVLGIEEARIPDVWEAAVRKGINLKPEIEGCPATKKLCKVGDKRLLAIAEKVGV